MREGRGKEVERGREEGREGGGCIAGQAKIISFCWDVKRLRIPTSCWSLWNALVHTYMYLIHIMHIYTHARSYKLCCTKTFTSQFNHWVQSTGGTKLKGRGKAGNRWPSFVYISSGNWGKTKYTLHRYGGREIEKEINRFKKTLKTGGNCSPTVEECSNMHGFTKQWKQ